ncbi:MAG: FKBP-type peptidyl-prolyl cis-trans isomerase [Patescibacteria group bacterium]
MKNLNQKQMLGVAAALVVVGIFLLSRSFVFSFFTQNLNSEVNVDNETNMTETINDSSADLKVVDVVVGGGAEAVAGKTIVVNYTGKLVDGTIFDSSYPRGEAFEFVLGAGQVISGWDTGVAGMKVGGKRVLTIPPDLAYGNRAVGAVIPANSTLIFEVELVDVR